MAKTNGAKIYIPKYESEEWPNMLLSYSKMDLLHLSLANKSYHISFY